MLTGNEPVSAGNLKASLGGFAHHRAGAYYETQVPPGISVARLETETISGEIGGKKEYIRIPIPASSNAVSGGTFENGVFTPDRPGLFEVSVYANNIILSSYSSGSDKWCLVVAAAGMDAVLANATTNAISGVDTSVVVAVPTEGAAIQFRVYYAYMNDRRVNVSMKDLKISIVEI